MPSSAVVELQLASSRTWPTLPCHLHLLCLRCVVDPQLLGLQHNMCACQLLSSTTHVSPVYCKFIREGVLGTSNLLLVLLAAAASLTKNSLSKGLTAGWPVSAVHTTAPSVCRFHLQGCVSKPDIPHLILQQGTSVQASCAAAVIVLCCGACCWAHLG